MRGERVKVNESQTLVGEREIRRRAWKKRVDSTVKEGTFQEGEGGQARRASLGDVEDLSSLRNIVLWHILRLVVVHSSTWRRSTALQGNSDSNRKANQDQAR